MASDLDVAIKKNQIRLTYDCYKFLNRRSHYDLVNKIKDSGNFGPSDCKCRAPGKCSNRMVTIKVGWFLEAIKGLGLLNEFEKYLEDTGRTVKPSYREYYEQHRVSGGQTPQLP